MTQSSIQWILSLNQLSHFWVQVQRQAAVVCLRIECWQHVFLFALDRSVPAILNIVPLPQFQPMPLGRIRELFSHPDWLFEIH
jgi:hypothetical protein